MKSACVFAALASTAAVAPPRISLNLEGMTSAYMLSKPIYRQHDQGLVNRKSTPGTVAKDEPVLSRQDWTEKCPANRMCPDGEDCEGEMNWVYTSAENCPSPAANAFDHNDRSVEVTTRIFRMDTEGVAENTEVPSIAKEAWKKRSTYLFKYDATDAHNNHAEQVVFALILDDVEAPFFKDNCEDGAAFRSSIQVEAVSGWTLCQSEVYDNIDTSFDIEYKVDFVGGTACSDGSVNTAFDTYNSNKDNSDNHSQDWSDYQTTVDFLNGNGGGVSHVGKYLVSARVDDNAKLYGHDTKNNRRTRLQTIRVVDTSAPAIELDGSTPEYVECHKHNAPGRSWKQDKLGGHESDVFYHDHENVCKDQLDTVALKAFLPVTTTFHKVDSHNNQDMKFVDVNDKTDKDKMYFQKFANLFRKFGGDRKHDMPVTVRTLEYTCGDFCGNKAPMRTREIHTVDTEAPTLTLSRGVNQKATGYNPTFTMEVHQSTCNKQYLEKTLTAAAEDSCAKTPVMGTPTWGPNEMDCAKLGHYVRTFTATDDVITNNVATGLVNVFVTDDVAPIITVQGPQQIKQEASRNHAYTDEGATCQDANTEDDNLDHAIEVSGDVVNMRVPGKYVTRYDCQDLSGNDAKFKTRTVEILCPDAKPVITLIGTPVNYVEAGFPYHDAGATATDSLDGDVTRYITTHGNTVEAGWTSRDKSSCQQIHDRKSPNQNLENGMYLINKNQEVSCYFYSNPAPKQGQAVTVTGFTYHIHEPQAAINNVCESMNMVKLTKAMDAFKPLKKFLNNRKEAFGWGTLDRYVCVSESEGPHSHKLQQGLSQEKDRKNGGKFVITYKVASKCGNNADFVRRTVIVKDTLPPVITLHLKNKLIHNGGKNRDGTPKNVGIEHMRVGGLTKAEYSARNNGVLSRKSWGQDEQFNTQGADYVNGAKVTKKTTHQFREQYNPAAYHPNTVTIPERINTQIKNRNMQTLSFGNPNLMAEATSTNGWILGAVVSAVAGVALLGFSRKSATSVPV